MLKEFRHLVLYVVPLLFPNIILGQIAPISTHNDTIKLALQRVTGLGPNGNMSFSTRLYADYNNKEDILAFPVLEKIPENLSNTSKLVYFFDEFQFYYQSYVAGLVSKSFFVEKAATNNWTLADTIRLSRQPLKCTFTVLTGLDSYQNEVYLLDANNNNDYSDDVMRPLLNNIRSEDQIVKNALSVKTTYLDKDVIRSSEVLVSIQRSGNPQRPDILVSFPQFDYAKFYYKGLPFILCAVREFSRRFVCVMPDRPYFTSIGRAAMVSTNHFVNILGENLKFLDYDFNKQTVTLTGNSAAFSQSSLVGLAGTGSGGVALQDNITVSDQVGFIAPDIKGINMNPLLNKNLEIALGNLRGKYVFVDFWSTYCAPCIAEFPNLKSVYSKYPRDKFEIIGVFDERNKALTNKLFADNGVTWPNILMNIKTTDVSGYGHVNSFPTSFLIDPSGRIIGYDFYNQDLMNKLKTLIGY